MIIRVRTLGEATIEIGPTRVGPNSSVLFGLLLFLASHEGKAVPRARLREVFWPNRPESNAWHSLRQLVFRIRQLGLPLEATASEIRLGRSLVDADFTLIEKGDISLSEQLAS